MDLGISGVTLQDGCQLLWTNGQIGFIVKYR